MKRLFVLVGWGVLALSLVYLGMEVSRHFDSLSGIRWSGGVFAMLAAATLVYAAALVIWGVGWAVLLTGLGEKIGPLAAFLLIGVSQIAKYLPGNVAHHIGRVALAKHDGHSASRVALSMALEFSYMVAACASCALFALAVSGHQILFGEHGLTALQVGLFLVAALCVPLSAGLLIHLKKPGFVLRRFPDGHFSLPNIAVSLANFFCHFVNFLLHGVVIIILAEGVLGLESPDYWLAVGVFSLAWLAGFIAPGAPAGLGIREALLIAGLSLSYATGDAVALAVLHRLTTIAGDVAVFWGALTLRRKFGADAVAVEK